MSLTFSLQALLVRHESHMVEAETERLRMTASIDRLEMSKRELEASNAKTIEENRTLLDQLEDLNNTVSESEVHIQSLTATLESTRHELQRLTVLAGRTAQLESQLLVLETEQADLQFQLTSSEENNRTAIQRWKRAEGTIGYLQDQVDRIEKESQEERERHIEVSGRMERQRIVEQELESAASRLKGAAAMTTLSRHQSGTNVVSHFVKDILQDNSNLQMGIVELREMLLGSNAEIEKLREQLLLHQPVDARDDPRKDSLAAELNREVGVDPALPELHVHHHYHGPEKTSRKPRKKRVGLTTGHFPPSSGYSTPSRAQRIQDWRSAPPSSTAAILSNTSVTVPALPRPAANRWSSQSNVSFAPSSVPSSPQSCYRSSVVFDSIDSTFDSSRPTTPGSSNPVSPMIIARDCRPVDKAANRGIPITSPNQPGSSNGVEYIDSSIDKDENAAIESSGFVDSNLTLAQSSRTRPPQLSFAKTRTYHSHGRSGSHASSLLQSPNPDMTPTGQLTIHEEPELLDEVDMPQTSFMDELSQPRLRRATSHESLLSISGIDNHPLRSRPSQKFSGRGFVPRSLYSQPSPTVAALTSSKPILSPTTATGRAASQGAGQDLSEFNRALLAHPRNNDDRTTKGKRMGGWVWGSWGVTPMASSGNLRAKVISVPPPVPEIWTRSPGVNQVGPIFGLRAPKRAATSVEPAHVDTSLLQAALEGD